MPAGKAYGHRAAHNVKPQDVADNCQHAEQPERGGGDGLVFLGYVPQEALVVGTVYAQNEQPGADQHHREEGVGGCERDVLYGRQ